MGVIARLRPASSVLFVPETLRRSIVRVGFRFDAMKVRRADEKRVAREDEKQQRDRHARPRTVSFLHTQPQLQTRFHLVKLAREIVDWRIYHQARRTMKPRRARSLKAPQPFRANPSGSARVSIYVVNKR